jgi:hypothetical protein
VQPCVAGAVNSIVNDFAVSPKACPNGGSPKELNPNVVDVTVFHCVSDLLQPRVHDMPRVHAPHGDGARGDIVKLRPAHRTVLRAIAEIDAGRFAVCNGAVIDLP